MRDPLERHRLYEEAVQTPEVEIDFFERLFETRFGRAPESLREDFCGTALLCRHWVESDPERTAHGVDLDEEALAAAERMNRADLDEDERRRFTLVRRDARALSERTFDLITAGNFSWALFDDEALGAYLEGAHACLEDQGLLALEIFGGADLRRPLVHEHRHPGFSYVWEQRTFHAATRTLEASIHFRRDDGRELRDAFRYRFVVRGFEETASALAAAGFGEITLYVERDAGGFALAQQEPSAAIWSGYVIGGRDG